MTRKELYQEFLKSDDWHNKREQIKERADSCCERCFDQVERGEVHHLSYHGKDDPETAGRWPKGWLCENEFLIYLCPDCHDREHGRSKSNTLAELAKRLEHWIKTGEL